MRADGEEDDGAGFAQRRFRLLCEAPFSSPFFAHRILSTPAWALRARSWSVCVRTVGIFPCQLQQWYNRFQRSKGRIAATVTEGALWRL